MDQIVDQMERIRKCDLFFKDRGVEAESEPEDFEYCSRAYWDCRSDIYEEELTLEDRLDAVNDMEQLAREGDMDAQYLMGKLYRDGPLLTPDSVKARYWFRQAAQQGHMYAQYSLGKLQLSDDIEVRDPESGIRWLEISAQNGNDYAAYRLGKEYYKGANVPRSYATAAQWFDRAAQDGNQYAQYMLGKMYLMGQGVQYDKKMGKHWLSKASYQGNSLPRSRPGGIQIDRKRLKKLQEKRAALGQKGNVYEAYKGPSMSM